MNERIRELQKQSSIEQWDYDNGCYRYVLNPEKFALLIVEECMEQLNISNVPAPISAGLNLGRVAIKEHFGVRE